jgi:ribonuclease HII
MLQLCVEGQEHLVFAGCDEVGRGAGAGCVTAAAVVWANDYVPAGEADAKLFASIRDSKKLSAKQRAKLSEFIKTNAVAYAVCDIGHTIVDDINILQATYKALHGALDGLGVEFDRVLVDGDKFKTYISPTTGEFVPHTCVVAGDNKFVSIASASILAKQHRDTLMESLAHEYPAYKWDKNKGYLTAEHIGAIREHGLCPLHRRTFTSKFVQ